MPLLRMSLRALLPAFLILSAGLDAQQPRTRAFNPDTDLLLAHFDCKTDVDDLHSVAALVTLLSHPEFRSVRYYAVAGAYGIQEGLYVPPNSLFEEAFGNRWSDAHSNFGRALLEVGAEVTQTLDNGGDVWIPEAGQSDFSAALIKHIRQGRPGTDTRERIHIVQHSDWNEEVTSAASLDYVRNFSHYQKIPDGNTVGNGTPGFRADKYIELKDLIKDSKLLNIWMLAIELGNRYNGKDGRYLNASVAAGGLDFSDVSETCWILGIADIADSAEFLNRFAR